MAKRQFMEKFNTAKEGVTELSKLGGRLCVATRGVHLDGRGGTK